MFHEHEKFDSLTKTNATLQAILAGDEIMNFIIPLRETYGRPGLVYSMAFCILFIICIHNVLIYIVAESFKLQNEQQEKDNRKIGRKASVHPNMTPFLKPNLNLDPAMLIHSEETLVSNQVFEEEQLVAGDEDINRVKTKVFNKIIPQSRETHIIDMTAKKAMIKDDIRYLKQSIQDLAAEQIGNPSLKRSHYEIIFTSFWTTLCRVFTEETIKDDKDLHRGRRDSRGLK